MVLAGIHIRWGREFKNEFQLRITGSEKSETVIRKDKTCTNGHYETVTTKKNFNVWLKRLKSSDLLAFDTETNSLNYMQQLGIDQHAQSFHGR